MATMSTNTIEERIGKTPFGGALTERYLVEGLDPSKASSVTLRQDLKLWLQKQGITQRSAVTAVDNSLARAYAHRPYLISWRKRVNPGFDLLGGDEEETFELEQTQTAASPTNGTAAPSLDLGQIEEVVKKLMDERFARQALSDKTRDEIKAVAELAASITADAVLAEKLPPRQIEVHNIAKEITVNVGLQHEKFALLIKVLQAKDHMGYSPNVWMTGPTGSGKTTAAQMVAKALGLEFEALASLDADYKVMGYTTPEGKYVETAFYRRFKDGGVILFDEIDNFAPSAILALNSATSNNFCQFPCGMVERHKDCIIIAAANTWGLGATNDYVGRSRLDAATLDRFQPKIDWPVDEKLERAIAQNMDAAVGIEWHELILKARAAVKRQGLKIIVSPRATYKGIGLLQQGFTNDEVMDMTFLAGLSAEQVAALDLKSTNASATDNDVRHALRMGNKIEAIKLHRQIHGTSLAEAKEAVEQIEEELV